MIGVLLAIVIFPAIKQWAGLGLRSFLLRGFDATPKLAVAERNPKWGMMREVNFGRTVREARPYSIRCSHAKEFSRKKLTLSPEEQFFPEGYG